MLQTFLQKRREWTLSEADLIPAPFPLSFFPKSRSSKLPVVLDGSCLQLHWELGPAPWGRQLKALYGRRQVGPSVYQLVFLIGVPKIPAQFK